MKNLAGKIIVITGAGSGISRALAHKLSEEGALLALADINELGLAETWETLPVRPAQVNTYRLDLMSRTGRQSMTLPTRYRPISARWTS